MQSRRNQYFTLSLAIFLIVTSIIYLLYALRTQPIEVQELPARFLVGDSIGIDVDPHALTYGRVQPGQTATRKVFLDNPYDFPIRVEVFADEPISDYLFAPQNLSLQPGANGTLPITLSVPMNMSFGNYTGKLSVAFYRT